MISLIWQTFLALEFLHVALFSLTSVLKFRLYLFWCKTFSVFFGCLVILGKLGQPVNVQFSIKWFSFFFFFLTCIPFPMAQTLFSPLAIISPLTTPSALTMVLSPTTSYHLPKLSPSSKTQTIIFPTLLSLWNCHSLTMAITRDVSFWRLRKTGNPCTSYPKCVKDRGLSR